MVRCPMWQRGQTSSGPANVAISDLACRGGRTKWKVEEGVETSGRCHYSLRLFAEQET